MLIKKITARNFRAFGRIIECRSDNTRTKNKNLFRKIIVESKKVGWRIAYLVVRDKSVKRLESHEDTFESFEPVGGKCLIFLAKERNPAAIKCFLLDKPIVLNKGVWHGLVTLSGQAGIKITENARVRSVYWPLCFSLKSAQVFPRLNIKKP